MATWQYKIVGIAHKNGEVIGYCTCNLTNLADITVSVLTIEQVKRLYAQEKVYAIKMLNQLDEKGGLFTLLDYPESRIPWFDFGNNKWTNADSIIVVYHDKPNDSWALARQGRIVWVTRKQLMGMYSTAMKATGNTPFLNISIDFEADTIKNRYTEFPVLTPDEEVKELPKPILRKNVIPEKTELEMQTEDAVGILSSFKDVYAFMETYFLGFRLKRQGREIKKLYTMEDRTSVFYSFKINEATKKRFLQTLKAGICNFMSKEGRGEYWERRTDACFDGYKKLWDYINSNIGRAISTKTTELVFGKCAYLAVDAMDVDFLKCYFFYISVYLLRVLHANNERDYGKGWILCHTEIGKKFTSDTHNATIASYVALFFMSPIYNEVYSILQEINREVNGVRIDKETRRVSGEVYEATNDSYLELITVQHKALICAYFACIHRSSIRGYYVRRHLKVMPENGQYFVKELATSTLSSYYLDEWRQRQVFRDWDNESRGYISGIDYNCIRFDIETTACIYAIIATKILNRMGNLRGPLDTSTIAYNTPKGFAQMGYCLQQKEDGVFYKDSIYSTPLRWVFGDYFYGNFQVVLQPYIRTFGDYWFSYRVLACVLRPQYIVSGCIRLSDLATKGCFSYFVLALYNRDMAYCMLRLVEGLQNTRPVMENSEYTLAVKHRLTLWALAFSTIFDFVEAARYEIEHLSWFNTLGRNWYNCGAKYAQDIIIPPGGGSYKGGLQAEVSNSNVLTMFTELAYLYVVMMTGTGKTLPQFWDIFEPFVSPNIRVSPQLSDATSLELRLLDIDFLSTLVHLHDEESYIVSVLQEQKKGVSGITKAFHVPGDFESAGQRDEGLSVYMLSNALYTCLARLDDAFDTLKKSWGSEPNTLKTAAGIYPATATEQSGSTLICWVQQCCKMNLYLDSSGMGYINRTYCQSGRRTNK